MTKENQLEKSSQIAPRTILITGASGGIGEAIASQLAADGFNLVLHYNKNQTAIDRLMERLKENYPAIEVRSLQFSMANKQGVSDLIAQDIEQFGAYYGVVYNAGIARDNAFPAMSVDEWESVLHTNLDGFYYVLHPAVMPMIGLKQGGRIVTIASISGLVGNRGQTNYSASKGGLIAATKALSIELAKRKITVNCVAPGIIETEMTAGLDSARYKEMVPLRRAGRPDEVASLVGYLISDQAAYITRQVISVNGGMC